MLHKLSNTMIVSVKVTKFVCPDVIEETDFDVEEETDVDVEDRQCCAFEEFRVFGVIVLVLVSLFEGELIVEGIVDVPSSELSLETEIRDEDGDVIMDLASIPETRTIVIECIHSVVEITVSPEMHSLSSRIPRSERELCFSMSIRYDPFLPRNLSIPGNSATSIEETDHYYGLNYDLILTVTVLIQD